MSIYTYNQSKAICECLEIPFEEHPILSDQELNKPPEDAKISSFFLYWNSSEEGKKQFSERVRGNKNPSKRKEVALKISKSLSGKRKTEEHKKNLRGNRPSISGKNHPMYGVNRSKEKNPMYGRVWITNGKLNRTILKTESLPDGFIFGVTRK